MAKKKAAKHEGKKEEVVPPKGKVVEEGRKEGDVYYCDTFKQWFKKIMYNGELAGFPCEPDGSGVQMPDEEEVLKTVYLRFRKQLGYTWLPKHALDAIHQLDIMMGLESVPFWTDHKTGERGGEENLDLATLHAAEIRRWQWGYADITQEHIDKALSDPSHIAERNRLEKKSKLSKTTLSEHSLFLHERTATYPTVSKQLRWLIKSHGWSLTALGELTNVDPSVLSRFMNEEQAITIETVDRLAKLMMLRLVPTSMDKAAYWRSVVEDRRKKKTPK